MAELDHALRELDADEYRFGPSHMDPALLGHAALNTSPAQQLGARMVSNMYLQCEQPLPPGDLFNPFPSHIHQGVAPYSNGSHGLHSNLTLDPNSGTIGPSYLDIVPRTTGQYFSPGVSNISLADYAFTSTAEAQHFSPGGQMLTAFDSTNVPFYFPGLTTTADVLAGLSMNGFSTSGISSSTALPVSNPPCISPFERVDFSVSSDSSMFSASAERPQLGPGPGLAKSLAERELNTSSARHDSSTRPVLRAPLNGQFFSDKRTSNGASYVDNIQNASDLLDNFLGSGIVSPVTEEHIATHDLADGPQWAAAPSPDGGGVERSCSQSPLQAVPSGRNSPNNRASSPEAQPTEDHRVLKFNTEGREKFHCYICDETYRGAVIFGNHMKGHGVLKCPTPGCGKKYKRWGELKSHLFTHAKQYACSSCKMPFAFQRDARRHYDSVHSSNVVKCPYSGCNREIHRRDNLLRHMLKCRWRS